MHMLRLMRGMTTKLNHYAIAFRQLRLAQGMPPLHEVSRRMLVDGEISIPTAHFVLVVGKWGGL